MGFNPEFYTNASPLISSQIAISTKNTLVTPQVIIVSDDGNKIIASVNGSQTANKTGFRTAFKAVDDFLEDGTLKKQPTRLKWYTTSKGSYRDLEFRGVTNDSFLLGASSSKPKKFAFKTFQPGALKFAKRYNAYHEEILTAAAVKEVSKDFISPENEDWVSEKGKNLVAQYVSLNSQDELTLLVKRTGYATKSYTMSLDKFDEVTQAKAKKWDIVIKDQIKKVEKAKADALNKGETPQKKAPKNKKSRKKGAKK